MRICQMKLFNSVRDKLRLIFMKARMEKNAKLLDDYNAGRILQIDNGVDNKEFLKNK